MNAFAQALGFGIASGAIITLGAVGLTVQVGISNVFNVTYGALMTLAAFIAYGLEQRGVSIWAAALCAILTLGVVSVVLNRILIAPLKRRGAGFVGAIIGTVYAGLIIQTLIVVVAGAGVVTYGNHWGPTVTGAGFTFTTIQLGIIGLTVACMVALHLLLTKTLFGRALRATAANENLARACGIRTRRVVDGAWFLTGSMCGAAGVALALTIVSFDFSLGGTFLIYMLSAAVLGGIGQPYGAMIGGLVVGIASQLAAAYSSPVYEDVAAFGILVVVLLTRPRGIFTRRGSLAGLWET